MKSAAVRLVFGTGAPLLLAALLAACTQKSTDAPAVSNPAEASPARTAPPAEVSGNATLAGLSVTGAWARATAPGTPVGAVYLTVTNQGTTEDTLMAFSTPAAAAAELHESTTDNGVAQMRPAGPQVLAAGQSLVAEPGGLHVMLNDLKAPLAEGQSLPLALSFKFAGTLTVQVPVKPLVAAAEEHAHEHAGP